MKRIYPGYEREIKNLTYKEEKLLGIIKNVSTDLANKAKITEGLERLRNELIEKYEKEASKGRDVNKLRGISEHIASINQKIRFLLTEFEKDIRYELELLKRIDEGEKIDENIINTLKQKIDNLSRKAKGYEKQMKEEIRYV